MVDGLVTRFAPNNQLGDHRVVEGRNQIAFLDAGFDPPFGAKIEVVQRAGGRQEAAVRILGVEARLDRMTVDVKRVLCQRDRFAARHAQLPFDQIDPGDFFGNRVLHLKPRVHLHEEDAIGAQTFAGVGDEFDRSGTLVIHRLGGAHGGGADFCAGGLVHAGGGGFLDHLLVAALERAVAFEQVDDIAVGIAEHLYLDMAGRGDPLLQQHLVIGEAGLGLAPAAFQHRLEIRSRIDLAHALATATRDGLDQHGIADGVGFGFEPLDRLVFPLVARRHRYTRRAHQLLGGILQTHRLDARWLGADPDQPRIDHRLCKGSVLGQETIARVDRVRAGLFRRGNDLFAHQVALGSWGGADMHCLVGGAHVQCARIGIRIDRDRGDTHVVRGADDAAGDFATIGDQELLDHAGAANLFCKALRAAGGAIHPRACSQLSWLDKQCRTAFWAVAQCRLLRGYQPATGLKSCLLHRIGSAGGAGRFHSASKKAATICAAFSGVLIRVRVSQASWPRSRTLRPMPP